MNIGSRLKQILDERQMNVNQLSREAGVSAQTLYAMIKRDSNKADMDIMARLLEALDMDLLEFLQMEPRKKKGAGAEMKNAAGVKKVKVTKKAVEESREAESVLELQGLAQEEPGEPETFSRYRRGEIEDYLL